MVQQVGQGTFGADRFGQGNRVAVLGFFTHSGLVASGVSGDGGNQCFLNHRDAQITRGVGVNRVVAFGGVGRGRPVNDGLFLEVVPGLHVLGRFDPTTVVHVGHIQGVNGVVALQEVDQQTTAKQVTSVRARDVARVGDVNQVACAKLVGGDRVKHNHVVSVR